MTMMMNLILQEKKNYKKSLKTMILCILGIYRLHSREKKGHGTMFLIR